MNGTSKQTREALLTALMLLGLLLAAVSPGMVYAQTTDDAGTVKVRVEITDVGFQPQTIEVPQGRLVELTFVWAHVGYIQEEHIMVLEGYKMESDKLDREHRETTIKFVADKSGTFTFKCDAVCEIHDYLQTGQLKVSRGGGGTVALTPTTLALTPSSWVTAGDPVSVMAVLHDPTGGPVAKAEIQLFLDTEFAGTKGKILLARVKSDANGVAFLDYQPTTNQALHQITGHFEGMGVYAESQQAIELQAIAAPASAYHQELIGLESARHWAPIGFVVGALAVWLSLGFVLYQAVGVAWVRTRR